MGLRSFGAAGAKGTRSPAVFRETDARRDRACEVTSERRPGCGTRRTRDGASVFSDQCSVPAWFDILGGPSRMTVPQLAQLDLAQRRALYAQAVAHLFT